MNNLYRVLLLLTLLMLSNVIATAQMGSPDTSFEEKQIVKMLRVFLKVLKINIIKTILLPLSASKKLWNIIRMTMQACMNFPSCMP